MKIKSLIIGTLLILGISCGKYEHGPSLSLRTKKERLDGDWYTQKIIWDDGKEETFDDDGLETMFISKTGVGEFYVDNGSGIIETTMFRWEFRDKKSKFKLTVENDGKVTVTEYKILRLTNKEFWVNQNDAVRKAEIHFQSK